MKTASYAVFLICFYLLYYKGVDIVKKLLSRGLLLSSVLLVAACSPNNGDDAQVEETTEEVNQPSEENSDQTAKDSPSDETDKATADGTLTIMDNAEHTVDVPANPQRVAVFDNGQLDVLQSLGLSDRVVATASDILPDYLSEFSDLPVAGTLFEIDLEVANAEEPELAIVGARSQESYDGLADTVPTLDLSNTIQNIWETLQSNLETYGKIFGVEEQAEGKIQGLEEQLTALAENASSSGLNALFLMTSEGQLSAYGPGSRFGHVHDLFGYEPVDSDIEVSRHGMDVSVEYVLEKNPDVIFLLDRGAAIGDESSISEFEENPVIQETTAYKEGNIVHLSPDMWYLTEGGFISFKTMMDEAAQPLN